MKKIYQVPALTIVRVGMTPILADSLPYDDRGTTETSGNLSRRGGSIWDDEDEEY